MTSLAPHGRPAAAAARGACGHRSWAIAGLTWRCAPRSSGGLPRSKLTCALLAAPMMAAAVLEAAARQRCNRRR